MKQNTDCPIARGVTKQVKSYAHYLIKLDLDVWDGYEASCDATNKVLNRYGTNKVDLDSLPKMWMNRISDR